jgi:enoyl-CoA hydratase
VKAVAMRMISRGPQARALARQAVRRGAGVSLEEGLSIEADLFGLISSTSEMKEGMAAFLEKRKPAFQGR